MIRNLRGLGFFAFCFLISSIGFSQTLPVAFTIPNKDRPALEAQLKLALEQEVRFAAKSFKVDWSASSLKCMTVESSEMTPDVPLGMCSIEVSAFQVAGKAAILKTNHGYVVSILQADVE